MSNTPDSFCSLFCWVKQAIPEAIRDGELEQVIDEACSSVEALKRRPVRERLTPRIDCDQIRQELRQLIQEPTVRPQSDPITVRRRRVSPHVPNEHERYASRCVEIIRKQCVNGMIRFGEICSHWIEPYPAEPINSLNATEAYLKEVSAHWFVGYQGIRNQETESCPENLAAAQINLSNVKRTIEWLSGTLPNCPPLPGPLPNAATADDAYQQRAHLLRWLKEAMRTFDNPKRRGRKRLKTNEEDLRLEIWSAWEEAKDQDHRTREEFIQSWNAGHSGRTITLRFLDACGAFVRKRKKDEKSTAEVS